MHAESQPVPPKIKLETTSSLALVTGIVLVAMVLGSGAVLFFFDPGRHGFYPICLFHMLTGLNCPGCGGTRAAYQLLHGHWLNALRDNALFVLLLAALAVWGARFVLLKVQNRPATFNVPSKVMWALLVLTVVFTVLRNLPGFSWLSPS